jgi:hypothetical protein
MKGDALSLRERDGQLSQPKEFGIGAENLCGFEAQVKMPGHRHEPARQMPSPSQPASNSSVIETPMLLLDAHRMCGQLGICQTCSRLVRIDGRDRQPT